MEKPIPEKISSELERVHGAKQLNWLQAARFVAAVLVLIFHVSVHLRNFFGFRLGVESFVAKLFWAQGVDLFFAISGFVMASALQTGKVWRFLGNRVLRIYLPLLIAVGVALAMQQVVLGQIPESLALPRALTLLPFGNISYPLGVEWSLVHEVFFYGVIALLIAVRRPALQWSLTGIWAAAMLWHGWQTRPASPPILPLGWEIVVSPFGLCFIAGMLAFRFRARTGLTRSCLVIVFLAGEITYWNWNPAWPGILTVLLLAITWGCAMALLVSVAERHDLAKENLLVRWGDWSYGMYLLHVPVILVVLGWFYSRQPLRLPYLQVWWIAFAFAMVVSMAFGKLESGIHARIKRRLAMPKILP